MVALTRLKSVRQRKALTQQQLAEQAGVDPAVIALLESGMGESLLVTVQKLAAALGAEPSDLLDDLEAWRSSSQALRTESGENPANVPPIAGSGDPDVRALLDQVHGEATLLDEAAKQIRRFIPNARLRLRMLVDPDKVGGEREQLLLGIAMELPDSQAVAALRRFDQEWWVHHIAQADGRLCIDLVYE